LLKAPLVVALIPRQRDEARLTSRPELEEHGFTPLTRRLANAFDNLVGRGDGFAADLDDDIARFQPLSSTAC
jgi:hypothetical protein